MKQSPVNSRFWPVVFIAPCALGVLVFTYWPTLQSLYYSCADWNLLGRPHWVGAANYSRLFQDPQFFQVMQTTWLFVVGSTVLEVGGGLCLALLLNRELKWAAWYRLSYFLPFVTPMVAVSLVWGWIYDPDMGILNQVLSQHIPWLYQPSTAMLCIMVLRLWKNVGYAMLLFLAGLQAIPVSLDEAASLDGADPWRHFWCLTFPMLSPTVFFVVLITMINAFQNFDAVYLLTQGGPNGSTQVLIYWMFEQAFLRYQIGPASATAYVLFAVIMVLTLIQWQLRKRWVLFEGDVS